MSKTKQILEISSPSMKCQHERLTDLTQQCNYCCGNGWFWGTDEYGESVKDPCPICEGTGKMRPEITVEWKPVSQSSDTHAKELTCCICGKPFYGNGNAPFPVKENGVCCDKCNWEVVLKERYRLSKEYGK